MSQTIKNARKDVERQWDRYHMGQFDVSLEEVVHLVTGVLGMGAGQARDQSLQTCTLDLVVAIAVEQEMLLPAGAAFDRVDHTLFGPARLLVNARMPSSSAHALVLSASVPMV